MARSESDYQPPSLPFESQDTHMDEEDFLIDRANWTFVNHGAFGGALRCGHVLAQQWRQYLERQPLRYFDRDLLPHLVYAARSLARFSGAERSGVALVPNATTALNAVIAGFVRTHHQKRRSTQEEPTIILWDTSYGSVKKMARQYGARVVEIPFQQDYLALMASKSANTTEIFLQAFQATINETPSLKNALLILDQTTSNTALNFPLEALARRAKEEEMWVLVDGAHGLLAHDVNVSRLHETGVDFYVSNGHKWLSCPRGVGILSCEDEDLRNTVLRQPPIVSHGIDDGYLSRFLWDGTRDYASQLVVPCVLDYWKTAKTDVVRQTLRTKLKQAVQVLAELWHHGCPSDLWPGQVTIAPLQLCSPMCLVRLPEPLCGQRHGTPHITKTSSDAKQVQDFLYDNQVEAPIKCINGVLYVRISCHVYNELQDYERLGNVILQFPMSR